jgi:hypothetical protein
MADIPIISVGGRLTSQQFVRLLGRAAGQMAVLLKTAG